GGCRAARRVLGRRAMRITVFRSPLALSLLVAGVCAAQPEAPPPPRPASPEIAANGDVTFRLHAPRAERVRLTRRGDIPGIGLGRGPESTKSVDGVLVLTLEALPPGTYRYAFDVDGVRTLDPGNRLTSESNSAPWSLFHVPGDDDMDTRDVPHGAVAEVT